MNLTEAEYERMQHLLAMEQFHKALTPDQRVELRRLLAKQTPSAKELDWDRLVEFGVLFVGATWLLRALTGSPRATLK